MKAKPSPVPPKDLNELRALVGESANGAGAGLGRKAFSTLVGILKEPHLTAVQSISEIANQQGVDPSTLTRLSQRLGFQGFPELHKLFFDHVVTRSGYYTDRAHRILAKRQDEGLKFVSELAGEEINNILEVSSTLDQSSLQKATDLLGESRRVYILGLRASYSIAHFFSYFLGFLRQDVILLGGGGFTIGEDLSRLTSEDVLVAISFRPYTNVTISAVRSAEARGVPVVALTDISSPISQNKYATVSLFAQSDYYFNSALSNFFLAQVLLSALTVKLGNDAMLGMRDMESQLYDLDIEVK